MSALFSPGEWLLMLANVFPIIVDSTLKGLVLLAGIWGVAGLLGRASAATRHTIWVLGILSLPCLTLLTLLLPGWEILPHGIGLEGGRRRAVY